MRRRSRVDDAIERYSNLRSVSAVERADVCLVMLDATQGVTEQDTKIAGLAHEAGKGVLLVVNKWDLVEKQTNTMRDMEAEIRRDLSFMPYAPVVFLSALTGQRVDKLYTCINDVAESNAMRITTGALNSVLADATARVQPPTDKGRRRPGSSRLILWSSATTPACFTSPISGIWKIKFGMSSAWRARPSA